MFSPEDVEQVAVLGGIKRSFLREACVLTSGTWVHFDVLTVDNIRFFPHWKYVLVTALTHDYTPIGFRDLSLNRLQATDTKCFGYRNECLPHHVANSWNDCEFGVPYRWFRLGAANANGHGFMIAETYVNQGLEDALHEFGNAVALKMEARRSALENMYPQSSEVRVVV